MDLTEIAARIDQTALYPDLNEAGVRLLCDEAEKYGFYRVFIPPCRVPLAVELLRQTPVMVGSVVGFPFGYTTSDLKAIEATKLIEAGAADIDMVINLGLVKDGRWTEVAADIAAVCAAAKKIHVPFEVTVKVIIETALLDEEEKVRAARTVKEAGADYVKTSTGYASTGAVAADVALLRATVGPSFGVKASGGIRTAVQFHEMVAAGADRIGTSAGVTIMEEEAGRAR